MEIILKSDNKTLEFVVGTQGINTGDWNSNDDFVQVLVARPETPLTDRESLAVVFGIDGKDQYTKPLRFLEMDGTYSCAIPNGVLMTEGEWELTILRRRYRNTDKTGDYSQIASNTYTFEVSESVKSNGTPVTATMLQTLYDNANKRATDAETAKAAAEASESKAKSYAESALAYRNAAQAAAENAAADATEKATKAAADAETAREAAVSAKDAAEMAQADAESAATLAAAEAVREVNERINETDTKVNSLETDIAVLNNALVIGGITAKATTETAYNARITADGLNVLDGSKAVLKKVVGSTVKCNNLIPFPYLTANNTNSAGTFTITAGADGSLTFNGSTAEYYQVRLVGMVLKAGTYYFSWNANKTAKGVSVAIVDKKYSEGKITITEQTTVKVFAIVQANTTADNVVFKPMLNEGDTPLPYERYFAGLKNASFAGIESTGRNLFKEPDNYTNGMLQQDGSIANNVNYRTTDYMSILGGLDFTISFDQTYVVDSGTTSFRVVIYDKSKTVLSYFAIYPTSVGRYSYTFTAPNDAVYYRIGTRITDKDIMLNAGITALPYEPYTSNTLSFPKTELGEWDKVDFEKQKVVRGTKTVVFDGTENWEQQTVANSNEMMNVNGIYSFMLKRVLPSISNTAGVCNMYNTVAEGFASVSVEGWMATTYSEFYFRTKAYTTVEEWKAHLAELYASGNPLIVAYGLATPTEEAFERGNEYRAYSGGTERVLENDNAEFGVKNTLLQNYIVVKE